MSLLPTGLRAFALAFLAILLFAMEAAFAKAIGTGIDLAQIGVIRSVIQFAFLAAVLKRGFAASFRTERPGMHVTRGLLSVTGLAAYFYIYAHLPMATATVLSFSGVLFTTMLAQTVLKEAVGWRRWSATIIGFCGILIVVRPGSQPFEFAMLVGIYFALNGAGINIATKGLTRTERTATIMAWIAAITLIVALPISAFTFAMPSAYSFWLMVCIGVSGTIGQFASVAAYRLADVSAIAPVLYFRIVIAAAIGYFVFSEVLDAATILGSAIVTLSALYITIRESRLAREREV
jgi:drug/metabolite transporter (DMT)-like permease